MHSSIIIASLLAIAGLSFAAPLQAHQANTTYYGVSIGVITSSGMDPNKTLEPAPVEINKLTRCYGGDGQGCSASELIVQNGTASNVNIDSIECRAYKDFAGVVPGSAPFNVSTPALITTNLATISSILCYIVPLPST